MKTKLWVLMLALFLFGATGSVNAQAKSDDDYKLSGGALAANMGTWKLNEAKSHIGKGAAKNHTVSYEMAGDIDTVKVIVDGTDASGTATHSEWTGKINGVYYPVSGDPVSDSRMYTRVNKSTLSITGQKDGKVVMTGTIAVSRNGKVRTVVTNINGRDNFNITGRNAKDRWVTSKAVYDKQ